MVDGCPGAVLLQQVLRYALARDTQVDVSSMGSTPLMHGLVSSPSPGRPPKHSHPTLRTRPGTLSAVAAACSRHAPFAAFDSAGRSPIPVLAL